jgi:hypothetical protein
VPSLKQAMQMARSGASGPVFVELPVGVSVLVTASSQQVAAEVYGATMNWNPPSVASSRQRQVQEEQKQINRRAREEEALIDEEERNLKEQEAILAAKARSRGARVRRKLDDRRFEVGATRSESLARVEDEMINDMGFDHGLDADSINSWVDGTHIDGGPEGDNITTLVTNPDTSRPVSGPDVTNMTETVSANVDPCINPFGTTTLVADFDHNIFRKNLQKKSTSTSVQALIDKEGRDLEELDAVDSANLIRDLAVDAERVLLDRTDAHMNDLVSGCGYSENANHEFVTEVPAQAYTHVAHNARFSSADEGGDESWNITTCRDIPSDMLIDLTRGRYFF